MTKAKDGIPPGQHTVTPHLVIRDAAVAIEFYKKAFGAQEVFCYKAPDGRIMQADIIIGDSHVFIADEFPEHGWGPSLQSIKDTYATVHLFVEDVDAVFKLAVDHGALPVMAPQDMFWGNRFGRIIDPFGQPWSMATHLEDLTDEEINKRGAQFFKQLAESKK